MLSENVTGIIAMNIFEPDLSVSARGKVRARRSWMFQARRNSSMGRSVFNYASSKRFGGRERSSSTGVGKSARIKAKEPLDPR